MQRTLVKSPPELWAELSDPASLARHLGELGEIRITKTKPEERVEWEADRISGTVSMKASGWGTKVTLSATREIAESEAIEPADSEQTQPANELQAAAASEAALTSPGPETEPDAQPTPELRSESTPIAEPRRGFFSRLFRRSPQPQPAAASEPKPQPPLASPPPEPRPEPIRVESAIESLEARFLVELDQAATEPASSAEAPADLSAELEAVEEISAEDVTAVLTAVLDRLGAAHHRPFSRS